MYALFHHSEGANSSNPYYFIVYFSIIPFLPVSLLPSVSVPFSARFFLFCVLSLVGHRSPVRKKSKRTKGETDTTKHTHARVRRKQQQHWNYTHTYVCVGAWVCVCVRSPLVQLCTASARVTLISPSSRRDSTQLEQPRKFVPYRSVFVCVSFCVFNSRVWCPSTHDRLWCFHFHPSRLTLTDSNEHSARTHKRTRFVNVRIQDWYLSTNTTTPPPLFLWMTSLENSVSPSWVVQILFGRYRSLGDLQWSHLAVMGGVGFVMLYVYLYFLKRKFRHYSKAISRLPKSINNNNNNNTCAYVNTHTHTRARAPTDSLILHLWRVLLPPCVGLL